MKGDEGSCKDSVEFQPSPREERTVDAEMERGEVFSFEYEMNVIRY